MKAVRTTCEEHRTRTDPTWICTRLDGADRATLRQVLRSHGIETLTEEEQAEAAVTALTERKTPAVISDAQLQVIDLDGKQCERHELRRSRDWSETAERPTVREIGATITLRDAQGQEATRQLLGDALLLRSRASGHALVRARGSDHALGDIQVVTTATGLMTSTMDDIVRMACEAYPLAWQRRRLSKRPARRQRFERQVAEGLLEHPTLATAARDWLVRYWVSRRLATLMPLDAARMTIDIDRRNGVTVRTDYARPGATPASAG